MSQSTPSRRLLWIVAVLAVVAVALWLLLRGRAESSAHAAAPRPLMVRTGDRLFVPEDSALRERLTVAAVAVQAGPHEVTLPAVVEADPARTVNVAPAATGRVEELKVRLGDTVRRGQLLAVTSSPDFAQAATDVQKARDALALAQRTLERAREVHAAGSNADKDVEAADSAVVQQTAELRRTELRLQSLNAGNSGPLRKDGLLDVRAPMDGSITALGVSPGTVLNDATVPLMTISNLDRVWVTANVPEDMVGQVARGQEASVVLSAYPHQPLGGRIEFVGALLDADSRRVKARISFANPSGLLKPNMFASVRVSVPQASQPEVPTSALLMNNDSVSVFVEAAPWTFVRRAVELGREDGDRVRVSSGLAAGERVVVRGGVLLND